MGRKSEAEAPRCSDCAHRAPGSDEHVFSFICRRFPPSPGGGTALGLWPVVRSGDWCGEFKLKEDGDER